MSRYDSKLIDVSWNGLPLNGFGDDYVFQVTQQGDSVTITKGRQGDSVSDVNNSRFWQASCTFKVDSEVLSTLESDNQNYVEGTLQGRDRNTGIVETFPNAIIMMIDGKQDQNDRTVTWNCPERVL